MTEKTPITPTVGREYFINVDNRLFRVRCIAITVDSNGAVFRRIDWQDSEWTTISIANEKIVAECPIIVPWYTRLFSFLLGPREVDFGPKAESKTESYGPGTI